MASVRRPCTGVSAATPMPADTLENSGTRRVGRPAALHERGRRLRAPHGMKARIAELIAALRRAEVAVSVAEAMDAARRRPWWASSAGACGTRSRRRS